MAKSVPEVAGQVQAAEALVMSEPEAVQALFLLVDFAFEPDFDFELCFAEALLPDFEVRFADLLLPFDFELCLVEVLLPADFCLPFRLVQE